MAQAFDTFILRVVRTAISPTYEFISGVVVVRRPPSANDANAKWANDFYYSIGSPAETSWVGITWSFGGNAASRSNSPTNIVISPSSPITGAQDPSTGRIVPKNPDEQQHGIITGEVPATLPLGDYTCNAGIGSPDVG